MSKAQSRRKKPWSTREKQFVKENAEMPIEEIAKQLNRPKTGVAHKISEIHRSTRGNPMMFEAILEALTELPHEELGVTRKQIRAYVNKHKDRLLGGENLTRTTCHTYLAKLEQQGKVVKIDKKVTRTRGRSNTFWKLVNN
jgi:predicted transcriptional regulator